MGVGRASKAVKPAGFGGILGGQFCRRQEREDHGSSHSHSFDNGDHSGARRRLQHEFDPFGRGEARSTLAPPPQPLAAAPAGTVTGAPLPPPDGGSPASRAHRRPPASPRSIPRCRRARAAAAASTDGEQPARPHRPPWRLDDHDARRQLPALHDAHDLGRRLSRLDAQLRQPRPADGLRLEHGGHAGAAPERLRHHASRGSIRRRRPSSPGRRKAAGRSPSRAERRLRARRRTSPHDAPKP